MGFGNWIEDYVNRIGESGLASDASGTSNIAQKVTADVANQNVSNEQSSSDEVMESKENDGVSPTAEESNRDKIRNLNKTFSDTEKDDDDGFFKLGDKQNRKMWEEQFIKDIGGKYADDRVFNLGYTTLSKDAENAYKKYEETGDIDDLYAAKRMAEEIVARTNGKTGWNEEAAKKWTSRFNEMKNKFDTAEKNESYMDTINSNGDYLTKLGSATTNLRSAMENFVNSPTAENYKRYNEAYGEWQPVNSQMSFDLSDALVNYNGGEYYNKYRDTISIDDDLAGRFDEANKKYLASKAKTTSDTVKEATKKAPVEESEKSEHIADVADKAEDKEAETKVVSRKTPSDTVKAANNVKATSSDNSFSKGSGYVDNIINKYRSKYGDGAIGNTLALRKLLTPQGYAAMIKDGLEGFKEFAKKVDAGEVSDEELAQLYDFLTKDENAEELFVSANRFYDKDTLLSGNAPIEKIESNTSKRTDETEYNLGLKREDEGKSKVASDEKVKSFFKTLLKFDPVVRKVGRI